jgi:cell division transport system ATP-binding protein
MIRLSGVGLEYGWAQPRAVLHDLRFSIESGEFRWVLGPPGAGKTCLLRLLYLAVRPTSGKLSVLGVDISGAKRHVLPGLRRRIGVVFQDFRLLPYLTTFDNVALPLRIAERTEAEVRADVRDILDWMGLAPKQDALPHELSGAEQQCVAIARAVIMRPQLLLADEPTGHLDEQQAQRQLTLFQELHRLGTTVLVATQNDALAARHPAASLYLERGRLIGEVRNG